MYIDNGINNKLVGLIRLLRRNYFALCRKTDIFTFCVC